MRLHICKIQGQNRICDEYCTNKGTKKTKMVSDSVNSIMIKETDTNRTQNLTPSAEGNRADVSI